MVDVKKQSTFIEELAMAEEEFGIRVMPSREVEKLDEPVGIPDGETHGKDEAGPKGA
jgi:hypothetical protein